ncbi:MAG: hypothetical protein ABSG56_23745 [Bryobacteraceae bacterium]|jgi:hypothetical protein
MIAHKAKMVWVLLGSAVFTTEAYACSIAGKISNVEMVNGADAVVRATAVEYASPPSNPQIWTTGVPDSKVRFKVIESIRGPVISDLILPGYLVDSDDFNDQQPPYTFVRPGGRAGSCFANSYRSGGQFLLFLKKTKAGGLTVNWYALAPVNEQLHSDDDPWLLWAREHAHRAEGAPNAETKPTAKK